jgi:uncharacterized membrane protein
MLLYFKIHHVQEGMRKRQHFIKFLLIVLVGLHHVCVCVCARSGIASVAPINFWMGEVEVSLSSPTCAVPFP